jgi:hypothetical protein
MFREVLQREEDRRRRAGRRPGVPGTIRERSIPASFDFCTVCRCYILKNHMSSLKKRHRENKISIFRRAAN